MSRKKARRNEVLDTKRKAPHKPGCECHRCVLGYIGVLIKYLEALDQRVKYLEGTKKDEAKNIAPSISKE